MGRTNCELFEFRPVTRLQNRHGQINRNPNYVKKNVMHCPVSILVKSVNIFELTITPSGTKPEPIWRNNEVSGTYTVDKSGYACFITESKF